MSAPTTALPTVSPGSANLRALLTPRWLLTSLLVVAAVLVMVRLGLWQLDRLAQRRAINAQYRQVMGLPPLDLNQVHDSVRLSAAVYQDATVRGRYDFDDEVLLLNQAWDNRPGYHLLTPLRIEGSDQAVLVDRGWIPLDTASPDPRAAYAEPGPVQVSGRLMPSQSESGLGAAVDPPLAEGQARLERWNRISLERIGQQTQPTLLPVYLLAAPQAGQPAPTQRNLPEVDLSEGPHESYAIQWFLFAAILAIGYPFYVRKQLRKPASAG